MYPVGPSDGYPPPTPEERSLLGVLKLIVTIIVFMVVVAAMGVACCGVTGTCLNG